MGYDFDCQKRKFAFFLGQDRIPTFTYLRARRGISFCLLIADGQGGVPLVHVPAPPARLVLWQCVLLPSTLSSVKIRSLWVRQPSPKVALTLLTIKSTSCCLPFRLNFLLRVKRAYLRFCSIRAKPVILPYATSIEILVATASATSFLSLAVMYLWGQLSYVRRYCRRVFRVVISHLVPRWHEARGRKQKRPVLTHTDHGKHQKANGARSLKNVPRLCISTSLNASFDKRMQAHSMPV